MFLAGKLAYAADQRGMLQIYDISDPVSPAQIGTFKTINSACDVEVAGKLAYVADDRGGVFIVDVSDPTKPTLVSNFHPDAERGQAMQLRVVGHLAYVAYGAAGLAILDVRDPSHPTLVSQAPGGFATGVQVRGDFAYVAAQVSVNIVDVSNPARPVTVSSVVTKEIASRLAVAGDLVHVADRFGGLQIIDLYSRSSALSTSDDSRGARKNASSAPSTESVWPGWPANSPAPAVAPFTTEQAHQHQQAWAKHLGLPVEITNKVGMKFALIPPGEFTMGSTPAEIAAALDIQSEPHWRKCIQSQGPQHQVILTQPFYLGIYHVTQAEYEQLIGKNPSYFASAEEATKVVAGLDTSRFPVEYVSWIDAQMFCAKLSEHERLAADGTGYGLPTEAQWEFACRAGTTTRHWISDNDEDLSRAAWFGTNSSGRVHAVGELQANPFGLFDMPGNVSDWVRDEWGPTYYETLAGKFAIDPSGPTTGDSHRVARGGNWNLAASHCLSSSRSSYGSGSIDRSVGFRLSLSVDAARKVLNSKLSQPPHAAIGRGSGHEEPKD